MRAALIFTVIFATTIFACQPPATAETVRKQDKVRTLSLQEATRLAIQQNPDVLRAIQDIETAYGVFIQVRAEALPLVNLGTSYNQTQETIATGSRNDKSWQVTLQVTQPLYTGGQVGASIRIARLTQSSSYYALEEVILSVVAEVRKEFALILLNRALIEVQKQTIELLNRQLQDTKNRFEAGTVPRFDVLRAEVEVANATPALIQAENGYRLSRFRLATLLGINPGALDSPEPPIDVVGDLVTTPPPIGLVAALAYARENRAVLKVREQNIDIGVEQIKVARSGYLPTVAASGGYLTRNNPAETALNQTNQGWFVGLTGSWNVWDSGATKGLVDQAKSQLEIAKISYDEAERLVALEVQDAYSRIEEAKAIIVSQEANVEQAFEALQLGEARFAAGASTQVEVLDARVALTTAQVAELQARFLYTFALADVLRVTAFDTKYDARIDDPLIRKAQPVDPSERANQRDVRPKRGNAPYTDVPKVAR